MTISLLHKFKENAPPSPAPFLLIFACVCYAAAAAKSLQLCPTLCDPIDGSPPGSPVPGILQARTLGNFLHPRQLLMGFYHQHKCSVTLSLQRRILQKETCCCVALVVSDSVQPHRRQPTRLPVPGILQARTLEWVLPFPPPMYESEKWKWSRSVVSDS